MADGPDLLSQLNQMGFGRGKSAGGGDGTNEKDALNGALDASGKASYNAAKIIGLPVNLSDLGQVSLTKPFDSEGLTGKTIMPSMIPDSQGGFLAKLLHDIFLKNRDITDQTGGTGGGATSGGGGDFGGGGGGFESFNTAGANFSSMASPSGDFDWSPVPMSSLGGFSPPATPMGGISTGAGMEM